MPTTSGAVPSVAVINCHGDEHRLFQDQYKAYAAVAGGNNDEGAELFQDPNFLSINALAIQANPADYTLWFLRRQYLTQHPQKMNLEELNFCRNFCARNLKSYQAWYHWRWLLGEGGLVLSEEEVAVEKDFTEQTLGLDAKNYTSWAHRNFISRRFSFKPRDEVAFADEFLVRDPCNNSAFTYKFKALKEVALEEAARAATENRDPTETAMEFWAAQVREGAERFKKEPFNEALVRFVLGCLRELLLASAAHSGAKGFGLGRLNSQAAEAAASAALVQEAMSELLAAAVSVLEVGKGGERFALEIGVAVDEARREYRSAAQKCLRLKQEDPIRKFFWSWKAAEFGKKDLDLQALP